MSSLKRIFICATCGSENISADAIAYWSKEEQEWKISGLMDEGHSCDDCGADVTLEEHFIE